MKEYYDVEILVEVEKDTMIAVAQGINGRAEPSKADIRKAYAKMLQALKQARNELLK